MEKREGHPLPPNIPVFIRLPGTQAGKEPEAGSRAGEAPWVSASLLQQGEKHPVPFHPQPKQQLFHEKRVKREKQQQENEGRGHSAGTSSA